MERIPIFAAIKTFVLFIWDHQEAKFQIIWPKVLFHSFSEGSFLFIEYLKAKIRMVVIDRFFGSIIG